MTTPHRALEHYRVTSGININTLGFGEKWHVDCIVQSEFYLKGESIMSYRRLFADQVEAFLRQPGAIALDIRDYQSYASGHLQGAEHADEYCMSKLIRKRREKPQVLVYCYYGTLSRNFAQLVHNLGIEQVYHLEGGYHSWAQVSGA